MIDDLKKFKRLWDFHRGNTISLLKTISDEELSFKVSENMGTLGQQFRHLCRVDDQYLTAIETKKVENNRKGPKSLLETSVSKLLEQMEEDNNRLFQILDNLSDEDALNMKIDWTYWKEENFNLLEHLNAMVEHEILHHGELVVYFRAMNKKFPKSWSAWGV